MRFADWFFGKIKTVAPATKKPNLDSWANTVRLMNENDNVSLRDMAEVFNWANSDSFWQTNILSIDKFRKQYPQLSVKMPKKQSAQPATPIKRPRAFGE